LHNKNFDPDQFDTDFTQALKNPLCRGGAWTSPENMLKSTYRDVVKNHFMAPFVGFRCAKDLE